MKRIMLFLVALLLFSVLVPTEARSQGEPCLPDCENSQWIPLPPADALVIPIVLCNTTFYLEYRYRHACNIWYDYYIEKIGGLNDNDIRDCITSTYGDLNNFLQAAMELLLIANPAGFPPINDGDCETNWRVMQGSCWTVTFLSVSESSSNSQSSGAYGEYCTPCSSNDCCLEYFTVCIVNGVRTITQTGYLPPEDPDCEGFGSNDPWYCQPVCGSIYNR